MDPSASVIVGLGFLLGGGVVVLADAAPCDAVPHLPVAAIDAAAQQVLLEVTAPDGCDWRLDAWAPFTLPARRPWWGPRQVTIGSPPTQASPRARRSSASVATTSASCRVRRRHDAVADGEALHIVALPRTGH